MIYLDIILAAVKAALALGSLWLTLRMLDKSVGVTFGKDTLPELRAGNVAVAMYYGLRFAGVCVLYAAIWLVPI